MSRKIIGVTVGTTLPKPNFKQTDPTKGDYIKNKPDFEGLKDRVDAVSGHVGDTAVSSQISTAINQIDFPVDSVNGKIGAVQLTAADVGALPASTFIPSTAGLATESYVDTKISEIDIPDVDFTGLATEDYVDAAVNSITHPVISVNGKTGEVTINAVPNCTADNNGQFLRVVNGVPTWAAIPNAEEASF